MNPPYKSQILVYRIERREVAIREQLISCKKALGNNKKGGGFKKFNKGKHMSLHILVIIIIHKLLSIQI